MQRKSCGELNVPWIHLVLYLKMTYVSFEYSSLSHFRYEMREWSYFLGCVKEFEKGVFQTGHSRISTERIAPHNICRSLFCRCVCFLEESANNRLLVISLPMGATPPSLLLSCFAHLINCLFWFLHWLMSGFITNQVSGKRIIVLHQ